MSGPNEQWKEDETPWVTYRTVNERPERVVDWATYFESARIDIEATRGMDADEIRETLPPPLIHGLLRTGSVAILAGATKVRKSWMALHMAIAYRMSRHFLGFKTEGGRVRYLDFELKTKTAAGRYALARLGVTDDPDEQAEIDEGISFHSMRSMPTEEGTLRGIGEWIEAAGKPGEIWILDCLQPVLEVDQNDNVKLRGEFRPLMKAAEKSGVALVIVDHYNKSADAKGMARVSGGVAKVAAVDAVITLTPRDGGIISVDFDLREDPPVDGETLVRFNSYTHGFDLVSSADAQAEQERIEHEQFMEWIGTGWPDSDAAHTRQDLIGPWKMRSISAASKRLNPLLAAGLVKEGPMRGRAKTYQLSLT